MGLRGHDDCGQRADGRVEDCRPTWHPDPPAHPREIPRVLRARPGAGRWPDTRGGLTAMDVIAHITVETLAQAKGLDAGWLRETFGLADGQWFDRELGRLPAVRIPYHDANGWRLFDKYRL